MEGLSKPMLLEISICLSILGAMKSTPLVVVEVILNINVLSNFTWNCKLWRGIYVGSCLEHKGYLRKPVEEWSSCEKGCTKTQKPQMKCRGGGQTLAFPPLHMKTLSIWNMASGLAFVSFWVNLYEELRRQPILMDQPFINGYRLWMAFNSTL